MSYCNEVYKITPDLYCIKDVQSINKYLILGSEKALLFDTGFGFEDFRSILSGITDKPVYIVNSHGDIDHASGNYLFEDTYMSIRDYGQMLKLDDPDYKKDQLDYRVNKTNGKLLEEISAEEWMKHSVFETRYHFIDDGDVFDLEDRQLEVIAVPGHTSGSIALLDRKNGMLFTGDTVMKYNIFLFHMPKINRYCEPLFVYYHSLKKLAKYQDEISWIFPGHGEYKLPFSFILDHMENVRDIYRNHAGDKKITSFIGLELYEHKYKDTLIYYAEDLYKEMLVHFADFDEW